MVLGVVLIAVCPEVHCLGSLTVLIVEYHHPLLPSRRGLA